MTRPLSQKRSKTASSLSIQIRNGEFTRPDRPCFMMAANFEKEVGYRDLGEISGASLRAMIGVHGAV